MANQTSATFLRVVGSELIQKCVAPPYSLSLGFGALFLWACFQKRGTFPLSSFFFRLFHFYRYLGDGPKLVRELFRVADEMSPTLVFIDEIDAVGSKRYESNSGGTREIQRTMLELLNQLDGFDERGDVKVIPFQSTTLWLIPFSCS